MSLHLDATFKTRSNTGRLSAGNDVESLSDQRGIDEELFLDASST
jgi:hypothetical protein